MKTKPTAGTRREGAPGQAAAPVLCGSGVASDPRSVSTAAPGANNADWVRLPKLGELLCGMKRSYLHQLCVRGTIRSVTIRQPGGKRGMRLIYQPSIHAFLASLDMAQNGKRDSVGLGAA